MFEAYFTNIYVEPRYEIYLYFCTGICAGKVSVGNTMKRFNKFVNKNSIGQKDFL